ncbi:MAG TPA: hypothetical protein VNO31_10485, partial [Umezawaea sp.]|nr:hypothetical protein [Umezawaea sp.]
DTVGGRGRSGMTRRWVRALAVAVGFDLFGVARLVWWTAERALPPTPEVHWSSGGGMSWCPGDRSCDPPVIPGGAVAVAAALAGAGVVLVVAVLVDVALRGRARSDAGG